MTEFSTGGDPLSRRVIDVAIGVLVGRRGCSEREAFDEIVCGVREAGVGLRSMARALVTLASDSDESGPHQAEALRRWGGVTRVGQRGMTDDAGAAAVSADPHKSARIYTSRGLPLGNWGRVGPSTPSVLPTARFVKFAATIDVDG